jgi:hypothetical protein
MLSAMSRTFTAFSGQDRVAHGALEDVARAAVAHTSSGQVVLFFDDATGEQIDLDLRGGEAAAVAEFLARTGAPPTAPRGRGRPRLGVTAREVTLLPRHWDWLAAQPGGASATLRRLVEAARRDAEGPDRARQARDAAYRVMSVLGGDLPGYEEAIRALYAGDEGRLAALVEAWPADIAAYALRLARTERVA